MTAVIWKAFDLGDLFERSTTLAYKKNQKDLNLREFKESEDDIALISASRNDSGRVGYLSQTDVPKELVSINKLTFDDQWGYVFFQKEKFVITGGHNAILELKDRKLEDLMNQYTKCYSFISLIINKITLKSGIFGYGYKINNRLDREIILLPCLEVSKTDEYIWEEGGRYYTLATEYISYMYLNGRVKHYQEMIDKYEYRY